VTTWAPPEDHAGYFMNTKLLAIAACATAAFLLIA
jgi:hypothetical protein